MERRRTGSFRPKRRTARETASTVKRKPRIYPPVGPSSAEGPPRKPEKTATEYLDDHTPDPRQMDPEWFSEIKFETGPVSIDYLRLDG